MRHRSRRHETDEELNVWSAVTDLMSNAFMILILFLFVAISRSMVLQQTIDMSLQNIEENKDIVSEMKKQIEALQTQANRNKELEQQIAELQKALQAQQERTDAPPIIMIEDEGAYRFASGSAEIPPQMGSYIRNKIVPEIELKAKQYQINVVELIGHTDGQPNGGTGSNLDLSIEQVANAELPVSNLRAGSNADLGLARALAVVSTLREIQAKEGKLKGLQFRAYSAAQLILPNGEFATPDRTADSTRRRIEIRFTRLGEVTKVQ